MHWGIMWLLFDVKNQYEKMLEIFQGIVLNNKLLIFNKLVKDNTRSRQSLPNQNLSFETTFFLY